MAHIRAGRSGHARESKRFSPLARIGQALLRRGKQILVAGRMWAVADRIVDKGHLWAAGPKPLPFPLVAGALATVA